jgi:hypothetical protein
VGAATWRTSCAASTVRLFGVYGRSAQQALSAAPLKLMTAIALPYRRSLSHTTARRRARPITAPMTSPSTIASRRGSGWKGTIIFGRVSGMRLGRVGGDNKLFEQNDRRINDDHKRCDDDLSA